MIQERKISFTTSKVTWASLIALIVAIVTATSLPFASQAQNMAVPADAQILEIKDIPMPIIKSIAFSTKGKTFASGWDDRAIRLWDADSSALKQTLKGHDDLVESVAFSPDGKILASGSDDRTVKLWRLGP